LAVKLRLTRRGKKKQPFYRIVAADSRAPRDGKYIEKVGHYNPLTHPAEIVIDEERVFYWLKNGAIPTETVKNLFSKKGIMLKWGLMKQGADENKVEEEYKKWEVLQLERQKRLEALAAQAEREKDQQEPEKEAQLEAAKDSPEPKTEEEAVEMSAESLTETSESSAGVKTESNDETASASEELDLTETAEQEASSEKK